MLTKKEFYRHLLKHNCEVNPFEGINITANQIEIVNKTNKKAKFYLSTPINDSIMPPKIIELACPRLGIPLPENYY